jgi:hypothetical protein
MENLRTAPQYTFAVVATELRPNLETLHQLISWTPLLRRPISRKIRR